MEMLPGLEEKYSLEVETLSKTKEEYRTAEHLASGLPLAPALMVADEVLVQGCTIKWETLESAILRHLRVG